MAPSVFSPAFHLRYFPRLLWSRQPRLGPPTVGPFADHALHEHTLLPVVAVVLLVTGTNLTSGPHETLGWVLAGVGGVGVVALLAHAVITRRGEAPTWERFAVSLFALAVAVGVGGGLIVGLRLPPMQLLAVAFGGLVLGYVAGLVAGYWAQALGYMEGLVRFLAGVGVIGVGLVDVLLLLAVWTRL
jgi:hypothetical protein